MERARMDSTRRAATLVGSLFLVAMVASLAGGAMVEGALAGADVLAAAAANPPALTTGVILELVNALAVVGIAVALYPLFRQKGEGAALGYVALRMLEAVALAAAAFIPVTLVTLGRQAATAGAAEAASMTVLGDQLLATRAGLAGILVPLFFCLGALLLYGWMLRSKTLPRFIPIWGLAGVAGIAAVNVFGVGMPAGMVLALPIILNEVFLGVWLVVKGFNGTQFTPRRAAAA